MPFQDVRFHVFEIFGNYQNERKRPKFRENVSVRNIRNYAKSNEKLTKLFVLDYLLLTETE